MIKQQIIPSIVMTVVMTIFAGLIFPVLVWGLGQLLFSDTANGSLIQNGEKIVGSRIIGQAFSSPKYFHGRPSAAGAGYDPLSSGGTNLGPTSKKLISGIDDDPATPDADESYPGVEDLARVYRETNGLAADALVPVDAVTRSGSGLDPHISIRNAQIQSVRVAKVRGLREQEVFDLIERLREPRFLGIFGEPRVNVLMLNLALDEKGKK